MIHLTRPSVTPIVDIVSGGFCPTGTPNGWTVRLVVWFIYNFFLIGEWIMDLWFCDIYLRCNLLFEKIYYEPVRI